MILDINNTNKAAVASTVQAQVVLTNGQVAFGNQRQISAAPGRSRVTWNFTLPTDWWAYPYTYDFTADVMPGNGLAGSRASQTFTMECAK